MPHRFPPNARRAGALAMFALGSWLLEEQHLGVQQVESRPVGWDAASHGDRTRPDYARLFNTDVVHEIRIVIPRDRYEAMQADLQTLVPAFPGRPAGRADGAGPPFPPSPAGPLPFAGRGGRGMAALSVRDPIYVPVTVHFNQRIWTRVAMRYRETPP